MSIPSHLHSKALVVPAKVVAFVPMQILLSPSNSSEILRMVVTILEVVNF